MAGDLDGQEKCGSVGVIEGRTRSVKRASESLWSWTDLKGKMC